LSRCPNCRLIETRPPDLSQVPSAFAKSWAFFTISWEVKSLTAIGDNVEDVMTHDAGYVREKLVVAVGFLNAGRDPLGKRLRRAWEEMSVLDPADFEDDGGAALLSHCKRGGSCTLSRVRCRSCRTRCLMPRVATFSASMTTWSGQPNGGSLLPAHACPHTSTDLCPCMA
jgi:hypothetical protein